MAKRLTAEKLSHVQRAALRYCARTCETQGGVNACKYGTLSAVKAIADGGTSVEAQKSARERCEMRFTGRGLRYVCRTGVRAVADGARQAKYGRPPFLRGR